jgi:hypothetical protein
MKLDAEARAYLDIEPQPDGHGLVIEPLKATDYVAGDGNLAGAIINPDGDWSHYIVDHEHQAPRFETNACASFGTIDALQALKKHFNSTVINLSDRFVAVTSETNPKVGNSPQKVAQAIRDNWSCLEEDWSMASATNAADYYKIIPSAIYAKAKTIKGNNVFTYHAIQNPTSAKIREELKRGAVCMSVAAWKSDSNGLYYKPQGWEDNHWVWVLSVNDEGHMKVKDTYEPFYKTVRADHLPAAAYRYNLNEDAVDGILVSLTNIAKWLLSFIIAQKPMPTPQPQTVPKEALLNAFALAVQKHEGWILTPPSRSVRNNNPGNCRYSSVGYHAKYGHVGEDKTGVNVKAGQRGFAIFKDYSTGFLYLKNLILEKAKKHPHWNLFDFFGDEKEGWAPKSDGNDFIRYAEQVAKAMNQNPATFRLKDLV